MYIFEAGERSQILYSGSETVVQAGRDVQFTCEAYGARRPFVIWYKDHSVIDQRHSRSFLLFISCLSFLFASSAVFAMVDFPLVQVINTNRNVNFVFRRPV